MPVVQPSEGKPPLPNISRRRFCGQWCH